MIQIQQSDNSTFTTSITDCNGANADIREATECSVPITTLRGEQYNLTWGSIVKAQLYAYNDYGDS